MRDAITLRKIAIKTNRLFVNCSKCNRRDSYNTASLVEKFDSDEPGP
jgi:hypothetical protein